MRGKIANEMKKKNTFFFFLSLGECAFLFFILNFRYFEWNNFFVSAFLFLLLWFVYVLLGAVLLFSWFLFLSCVISLGIHTRGHRKYVFILN